jgi:hypothetical protein
MQRLASAITAISITPPAPGDRVRVVVFAATG